MYPDQDIVFVLQKIKRSEDQYFSGRENNTVFFNIFNETDRNNFHVYIKAQVIDVNKDSFFKLKLFSKKQ